MAYEALHGDACPDCFRQIVDDLPTAIMICDPATFEIVYVNEASRRALHRVQHLLPGGATQMPGSCFDMFHGDPSLRRLLSEPRNLPHDVKIELGDQWLEFRASAMHGDGGRCVALKLEWRIMPSQIRFPDGASPDSASNVVELIPSAVSDPGGSPNNGAVGEDAGGAGEVAEVSDEMLDRLVVTGDKLKQLAQIVREIVARSNALTDNAATARAPSEKNDGAADGRLAPPNDLSERVLQIQRELRKVQEPMGPGD